MLRFVLEATFCMVVGGIGVITVCVAVGCVAVLIKAIKEDFK